MVALPIGQNLVIIGQNLVNVGQILIVFCPMSDYALSVTGQNRRENDHDAAKIQPKKASV